MGNVLLIENAAFKFLGCNRNTYLNINLILKCYCGYFYSNSGGFITMFFKVHAKFLHNLATQLPVLSMGTMCSPTKKGKAETVLSGFLT